MRWYFTIAGESHTKNALLRLRLFLLTRFPVPTLSSGSRQLQSRNLLEKFNDLVPTGNQDSRQFPFRPFGDRGGLFIEGPFGV
jgi:hypothetical protein